MRPRVSRPGVFRLCVRHDGASLTDARNWLAKASQEVTCRVQVPMEALMTGTLSRTAWMSGATLNLKQAAGKLPVRGTRTTYEATAC